MRTGIGLLLISLFLPITVFAKPILILDVNTAIGPGTVDYVERGLMHAHKNGAELVILRLNTPGGLETAMRSINQTILSSSIPIVIYVAPSGARAASAGMFILYASHIAAMAPGTNIGAASPVSIGMTDSSEKKQASTHEKKATNDAVAYIQSLAKLRHRNATFGENAIRNAASLSADAALNQHVIDLMAVNVDDLLQKINGRTVTLQNTTQTLATTHAQIEVWPPDWRFQFLSVITHPSIAYILLLIGFYGLFFEFANPGFVLPGIFGTIALLLALYALQLLPINYAGLTLLLVGILCMGAEIWIMSFGILGIAGLIAFIIGSIMLFDSEVPGYSIAWSIIVMMSVVTALFFFSLMWLTLRSWRKPIVTGREALIGLEGEVLEYHADYTLVRVQGELWSAQCSTHLQPGEKVRVKKMTDLILTVEPITDGRNTP